MTSTAERLMALASEAEDKADDYAHRLYARPLADQWERETIQSKIDFHRGQASGFRQSAYFAAILEGTNAND